MNIRLYLVITAVSIILLFAAFWSWSIYQTYTATKFLTAANTELAPVSQSAMALEQHWDERLQAISARLDGIGTKDEIQKQADTAADGITQEMKHLEKLIGSLSTTAQQTDIKPQKALRDLRNSVAVIQDADTTIFSVASPSATMEPIRTYMTTLNQETLTLHKITTDLQSPPAQAAHLASQKLGLLLKWWPALLAVLIACSGLITWMMVRFLNGKMASLTQQLSSTLSQSLADPAQRDAVAALPLPDLVVQITTKINANDGILKESAAHNAEEIQKLKMGLEKIISEQKRQYEEKISELSTLNKAMIGRELKMARLKQEIHDLKQKLGIHDSADIR